jgi:hypothetical protein
MRISRVLFRAAQVVWLFVLLSTSLLLVIAIPSRFAQLSRLGARLDFASGRLGPTEAGLLSQLGLSLPLYAGYITFLEALTAIGGVVVGAIIFWRKRDDWLAILVSISLITLGAFPSALITSVLTYLPFLASLTLILQFVAVGPTNLIFYLFPDGRFVPSWTRFAAALWLLHSVSWLFVPALRPSTLFALQTAPPWQILFILAALVIGVYSQIYRYRRHSTSSQRQQTKWIVFGFVLTLSLTVIFGTAAAFFSLGEPTTSTVVFLLVTVAVFQLALLIPPVAVMLSMFKYHLWDVDILIRRTATYALVTGALLVIFFASVIILQQLFASLTGARQNELVTVLSTLAIAALFVPLRNRVQGIIDRRFYRRKYDAQQVLARFAETVRDETDIEKLTGNLVEVVDETMQPRTVSLWLRGQNR